MNISLNSFVESLLNPNGRFKTLAEIIVEKDNQGSAIMHTNSDTVNFWVKVDGKPYVLRCISKPDATNIKESVSYASLTDSPHLSSARYLEKEMVVFDSFGNPRQVDVVLEGIPSGKRLDKQIDALFSLNDSNNKDEIKNLISGLINLAEWLDENQFSHGKIGINNLWISSDNTPVLIDYTAVSRQKPLEEIRRLATIIATLYISATDSRFFSLMAPNLLARGGFSQNSFAIFEQLSQTTLPDELALLLKSISDPSDDNSTHLTESLLNAMRGIEDSTFQQLPTISKYLDTLYGKSVEFKPNKKEALQKKIEQYQFVGQLSDMLMRAWDGKKWCYIDKDGNKVIEGDFMSATDFDEGLAVVEIEEGYGLINRDGKYIILPIYHDIEWNSIGNVVIATKEGLSGIFTREGKAVSGLVFDRILDVSEGLLAAKRGKHYGYVTRDGKTAIPFIYDDAFGFRNGVARVSYKGRDFLIDSNGEEVEEIGLRQKKIELFA